MMNPLSRSTKFIHLLLLLAAAMGLLACGLGPISLPGLLARATPEPAPVTQYPITLTSVKQGLDDLQSYRANLVIEFEGIRNRQPAAGQIVSLTELTRQPSALRRYLEAGTTLTNAQITAGATEFFRVDDKVYLKRAGDDTWLTFTDPQASPDSLGFFEFERLMALPPTVSNPPRLEALNDLTVQHYTFSEKDLTTDPNLVFEQAQGDLWIAIPGNYLMQYAISATLRVVIPDPKAHLFDQGHLNLRYTLTDLDAAFTISPPVEAVATTGTLSSLPRLPDAELISVFPSLIEYTSAISAISATLFYRDQLSTLHWTEEQATIFNEKAQLHFSQADQALNVIITPADEPDKIKVVLSIDQR